MKCLGLGSLPERSSPRDVDPGSTGAPVLEQKIQVPGPETIFQEYYWHWTLGTVQDTVVEKPCLGFGKYFSGLKYFR